MEENSQFLNTPNDTFSEWGDISSLIEFLTSNEDRQDLIEWNPSNTDIEDFSEDLEQIIRHCVIDDFPPSSGTYNGDLLSDLSMLDPIEDSYDIKVSNNCPRQSNLDLNIPLASSSDTSTDVQHFDLDQTDLDCIKLSNNVDYHQQNFDLVHTWATPLHRGTGLRSENVNFHSSYQSENLVLDKFNHQNYNNIDKNYSSDIQNLDTHKFIINDVMLNSNNRINEEINPFKHDPTTNSFDETMESDEMNLFLGSQIENYSLNPDHFFDLDFDLLGDSQILERQLAPLIDLQNPNVSTIQPEDTTVSENILLNKCTLASKICVPSMSYQESSNQQIFRFKASECTDDIDKAFLNFFDQFTSSHSIDLNHKNLNAISQIVARSKANPVEITRIRRPGGGCKAKNYSKMPKGLTLEQQKNWKANKSCQMSREKKKQRELEDKMRYEQLKTDIEQLDDKYLKVLEKAKILSKELINSYRKNCGAFK